jgi:hypothetical protein
LPVSGGSQAISPFIQPEAFLTNGEKISRNEHRMWRTIYSFDREPAIATSLNVEETLKSLNSESTHRSHGLSFPSLVNLIL